MPTIDWAVGTAARQGSARARAVIAAALLVGCNSSRDDRLWRNASRFDVGDASVALIMDPRAPRQGENELHFELLHVDGSPLKGATAVVVASMPAMGSMPYMESRGRAVESSPGEYRARYSLSMQGEWELDLVAWNVGAPRVHWHWQLRTGSYGLRFVPDGSLRASGPAALASADSPAGSTAESPPNTTRATSVWIDPATWGRVGIEVVPVVPHPTLRTFSSMGQVTYDETRTVDVATRVSGRIRQMEAIEVGTVVRADQVLCSAYSPEMIAAEQDFLNTVNIARGQSGPSVDGDRLMELMSTARIKLAGWDLPQSTIDSIQELHKLVQNFRIVSPVAGVITQKAVIHGSFFTPGQVLFQIAPTDPVRVVLNLPESQRDFARVGAAVEILDPPTSGSPRLGRIVAVGPAIDERTRTLPVSVTCRNPDGILRAGALVRARTSLPTSEGIEVPESAILYSSGSTRVCVETSRGRFEVREIEASESSAGRVVIHSGVAAGERVAVSGAFLIAAQWRSTHSVDR